MVSSHTTSLALLQHQILDVGKLWSGDTWKRATSQEHFEKIIHGERRLGEYTLRQLCILSLKLCKQLPYSPITWLFLTLLGSISAIYA